MSISYGGINDRRFYNNDFASNNFLQINSCGIYNGTLETKSVFRPLGRNDYQLIVVTRGQMLFKHEGRDIRLIKDELIIIPPNVTNEYYYIDNPSTMWIHFTGSHSQKILDECDIQPFVTYKLSGSFELISHLKNIIVELQLKKACYMNACNGHFLNLLTTIKRKIEEAQQLSSRKSPNLTTVINDMNTNITQNRTIAEYAQMCNFSVSRFNHLFRDKFGVPPHTYLLNLRIELAKDLLVSTKFLISDITKMIGYDDPLYFSRCFKEKVGISPLKYRKKFEKSQEI